MKRLLFFITILISTQVGAQTYSDSMYQKFDESFNRLYDGNSNLVPDDVKINLKDSIYAYVITNDDLKKITAISDILKMKKNEGIYSYDAYFFVKTSQLQLYIDEGHNVLLTATIEDCIKRAGPGSFFILAKIHFDGDGISENHVPIVIKVI
ncbi:MAG: hypothetical protein ACHQFW_07360 [Chitinophagales bacterium]